MTEEANIDLYVNDTIYTTASYAEAVTGVTGRFPTDIPTQNLQKMKTHTSDRKSFEVLSAYCGSKTVEAVRMKETTANDDGEEVKTITEMDYQRVHIYFHSEYF